MSDPNHPKAEEYIVHLVGKVITVSLDTVRLVSEVAQAVTHEDWISETSVVQNNLALSAMISSVRLRLSWEKKLLLLR